MQPLLLLLGCLLSYILGWTLYTRHIHPYARIPGPYLASLSRLWLLKSVMLGGRFHEATRALHARYGPIVRIAPDEVSISDPEAVHRIYGVKPVFPKTDFYEGFGVGVSPNGNIFTILSERQHTERRRIVQASYTMSSVLEQEKFIDSCLGLFGRKMRDAAESGKPVDMGDWLWKYTFDVIGELFFGRHFGFMEKDYDYQGWMEMLDDLFPVMVMTCLLPKYARSAVFILGLLHPKIRKGIPGIQRLQQASIDTVEQRRAEMERGKPTRNDMLSKAFSLYEADRHDEKKGSHQKMLLEDVQSEALTAIGAGSETTAIALRAIIHNILTHPDVYRKLLAEIDAADREQRLSRPYVRYNEAIKLPYLVACCKEGMRVHPSIALTFPRHVPAGGLKVGDTYLPEGYKVGINPAVVQYDQGVYGHDADKYNPERWLGENSAQMDRHMMVFGSGKRVCIGINIALVEMYKLVPHLLRDWHLELTAKKMRIKNVWFVRQYDFEVKVTKREVNSSAE